MNKELERFIEGCIEGLLRRPFEPYVEPTLGGTVTESGLSAGRRPLVTQKPSTPSQSKR